LIKKSRPLNFFRLSLFIVLIAQSALARELFAVESIALEPILKSIPLPIPINDLLLDNVALEEVINSLQIEAGMTQGGAQEFVKASIDLNRVISA